MAKKKSKIDKAVHLSCLNGTSFWEFVSPFNETCICHDGPSGLRIEEEGKPMSSLPSSSYPSASALACSFDPEVARGAALSMAQSFADSRTDLALAPAINIKRSCLCGRNWEYFSEDPLVSGTFGAAMVNGLQSGGVGACLKHYLCNNQEYYRFINESVVSDRALRTIYSKAFEVALSLSNPAAVMTSYNRVNGEYVHESEYLLGLLRNDFGFDSLIISDWGAATANEGKAFKAGLNIEMPYRASAAQDYRKGYGSQFNEEDLDKRLTEIGRFFSFIKRNKKALKAHDAKKDYKDALKAYEKCVVLAKNEGFFPLKKNDDVLVVGYLAEAPHYVGGGSGRTEASIKKNYLDVLKDQGHTFVYINGYLPGKTLVQDALASEAKKHKKVLFFMGQYPESETEGKDRESFALPHEQIVALATVLNNNANVGVILETGSPVDVSIMKKYAKGLFIAYPGGMGMSEAIYNLAYGKANPSGHLAETWPLSLKDNPVYEKWHEDAYHTYYDEDIYVGYRYYDSFNKEVAYPFGHGLSYSEYRYSDLSVSQVRGAIEATVFVENISDNDGEALVMVFAHSDSSVLYREEKSLIGFKKVFLLSHEKKPLTIRIPYSNLYVYPAKGESPFIEEGNYVLLAGGSIVDLPLSKTIWIKGKKAKASKSPEVLRRHHYDYEYRFDWNSPAAAFNYISDYFKSRKQLFKSEADFQYFLNAEEPIRIILNNPRFDKESVQKAIDEANQKIGGKSFIQLTK